MQFSINVFFSFWFLSDCLEYKKIIFIVFFIEFLGFYLLIQSYISFSQTIENLTRYDCKKFFLNAYQRIPTTNLSQNPDTSSIISQLSQPQTFTRISYVENPYTFDEKQVPLTELLTHDHKIKSSPVTIAKLINRNTTQ